MKGRCIPWVRTWNLDVLHDLQTFLPHFSSFIYCAVVSRPCPLSPFVCPRFEAECFIHSQIFCCAVLNHRFSYGYEETCDRIEHLYWLIHFTIVVAIEVISLNSTNYIDATRTSRPNPNDNTFFKKPEYQTSWRRYIRSALCETFCLDHILWPSTRNGNIMPFVFKNLSLFLDREQ